MKRPAFQFYPGDWLEDMGLRACSLSARGLWVDLLCFMHQGEPYGHLRRNGRDVEPEALALMVGASRGNVVRLLAELEERHVFSRTEDGTIYSRRQVRDEELRDKRAAYGVLSQNNPNVPRSKDCQQDTSMDSSKDTLSPSIGGSPSSPSPSPSPSPTSTPENERLLSVVGENANGLTDEQRQEYADAVWSAFLERTGQRTRLAGSSDFLAMKGWMDQGIPLRIVLRGIQDTKGQGRSLAYYGPSVQEAFAYWRRQTA